MKYNTLYSFILAVFLAVALAVSCSKADPESEGEPAPQVYTMTVNASRVYTKALEEDTSATSPRIVSTWTAGDVITVWTSDGSSRQYGQLSAQTSGSSTTFSGTLTSLPSDGEELLLLPDGLLGCIVDRSAGGVITGVDPQKKCHYCAASSRFGKERVYAPSTPLMKAVSSW